MSKKSCFLFILTIVFSQNTRYNVNINVRSKKASEKRTLWDYDMLFDECGDESIARKKLCARRLEIFTKDYKKRWLLDNKPFGWEIQQARLGGLYARLLDCKERLSAYLQGNKDAVIELDEKILPYVDEWGLNFNSYRALVTPSEL